MQEASSSSARPDRRSLALSWAQSILKEDNVTKTQDRPYMEAVLATAAMMEQPIKSLAVAINDCGDHYKITLKGYKLLMSHETWYLTFKHPDHRDEMLNLVTGTYTQLPNNSGFVKVIQLNKAVFLTTPAPASSSSSLRKRSQSHSYDVQDEILQPDRKGIGIAWAKQVLKEDAVTRTQDMPYMEAVLATAAMMEQPVESLSVAINDAGNHYKIAIKGYKLLMSDEAWYLTFKGPDRDYMLDNVTGTYVQEPLDSGPVLVIQLNKVVFLTPAPTSQRHHQHKKRDDDVSDQTPSQIPSSARRFRKRE